MRKIILFLVLLLSLISCTTYKVFYVMPFDNGTYEYMFKRGDDYIGIMTDSLYYQVWDKVKLEDIEKLKK